MQKGSHQLFDLFMLEIRLQGLGTSGIIEDQPFAENLQSVF
jgi:hypothetical protein